MSDSKIRTLEDIQAFLEGTTEMKFSIEDKDECYRWIELKPCGDSSIAHSAALNVVWYYVIFKGSAVIPARA